MFNKQYKINFFRLFIIVLGIFFVTFLSFTFKEDEEVTMGFMNHSIKGIIKIDSLDVHPPLYYILLKIFLNIFTFWTKSIFVKTIFARLFSIITFLITFHFLCKINKLSNINVNKIVVFIIFCLMPSILEVATHLRMYQLVTLFITIEYYELINFHKKNKIKYLLTSSIFALLASYTHYFIAIIAGLLIFIFCMKELLFKNFNKCIKLIISGFSIIIFYLPIIPYVLKQLINRSKFPSANTGVFDQTISSLVQLTSNGSVIKEIFDLLLFISLIVFTFLLIKRIRNKGIITRLYEIISCISMSIFIEIVISLFYKPFFECRFIFPLISIYFFFVVTILIKEGIWNRNKIFILFLILSSLLIFISDGNKMKQNITQYDVPSAMLIHNFNKDKMMKGRDINVFHRQFPTQFGEALYATQSSVYLKSINKNAIVYNSTQTNLYLECNNNKYFVHKLFNNLCTK